LIRKATLDVTDSLCLTTEVRCNLPFVGSLTPPSLVQLHRVYFSYLLCVYSEKQMLGRLVALPGPCSRASAQRAAGATP
jgi:hypothetical protein